MRPNRFLGAALCAMTMLSARVNAQSTALRIISDPLFLPDQGQIYGATVYTLSMPKGDNSKNGAHTSSFTASNSLFDQTIAYGITRDFTVRAAMSYGWNHRDSTSAVTGDVTNGNSRGFNDPTFGVTWRALDEMRSPVVVDLTGSYSPDALHATSSGGGSDGNLARGGYAASFSAALGRVTRRFTYAVTGGATALGRQTTELLSNGTTTAADSHWNYNAGLSTQARIADRVSFNLGLGFSTTGSYTVSNVQNGNPRMSEGPDVRSFDAALNYRLVPDRFVAAITYGFNSDTMSQNVFPNPASDTAVTGRTASTVGIRLMYAFN